jgi:hypothetical protein
MNEGDIISFKRRGIAVRKTGKRKKELREIVCMPMPKKEISRRFFYGRRIFVLALLYLVICPSASHSMQNFIL